VAGCAWVTAAVGSKLGYPSAPSEFRFLGGSIGQAAGDRIVAAVRLATTKRLPLMAATSSGGTRMQEGKHHQRAGQHQRQHWHHPGGGQLGQRGAVVLR
jgi:acetyl-CoA carboxylase carboxyltransferase component